MHSLLIVFILVSTSCCHTHGLQQLQQLSILQKEDVISYYYNRKQFNLSAQQALKLVEQSPKVKRLLEDDTYKLLFEKFPTLEQPFFIINIRQAWEGRLQRLVAFQVHANTKDIRVETPLFSEAYNNGVYDISLEEWEWEETTK